MARHLLVLVVFFLLLELLVIVNGSLLVLLVLRDKIVHVGLSLGEFHFVHTLTCVPVEESLSPEHSGELLAYSLEQLLDGGRVTDEGSGHLKTPWWDVAHRGLDVIWDPLDKVAGVLVLDSQHLLVNFLHGHTAPEDGSHCEVSAMSGVTRSHHVLSIEHCCVSSGTVSARYCWAPLAVRGANPGMKKCSLGKGTMLTASFLRSELSCPGNLRQVVTPDMVKETRWLRSP